MGTIAVSHSEILLIRRQFRSVDARSKDPPLVRAPDGWIRLEVTSGDLS